MTNFTSILKTKKGVAYALGVVLCVIIVFLPTEDDAPTKVVDQTNNKAPSGFDNYDPETPIHFDQDEIIEPLLVVRNDTSREIKTIDPRSIQEQVEQRREAIEEKRKVDTKPYGLGLYRKVQNDSKSTETRPVIALDPTHARPISEISADSVVDSGFAPYGRLLKCQLVNTVDSFNLQTPIVGLVVEDLWWNGRLLVPAGSEVHGTATTNQVRSRISSGENWLIVLPGGDERINGSSLRVTGYALDHSPRAKNGGEYALSDGSFGLLGDTIRTDNLDQIRLFAATFLSAATSGLQTTETTIAGTTTIQPDSRNAALGGVSAVMNDYAQQIRDEIERNGFFTRVPAGKDFYLYVTQAIDLTAVKVGEDRLATIEQTQLPRNLQNQ